MTHGSVEITPKAALMFRDAAPQSAQPTAKPVNATRDVQKPVSCQWQCACPKTNFSPALWSTQLFGRKCIGEAQCFWLFYTRVRRLAPRQYERVHKQCTWVEIQCRSLSNRRRTSSWRMVSTGSKTAAKHNACALLHDIPPTSSREQL